MWNEFTEPDFDLPNEVADKLIIGFDKKTNNLADIRVVERKGFSKKSNALTKAFQYSIVLGSQYLKDYSYEVARFGFDIDCYPLEVLVNDGIAAEWCKSEYDEAVTIFYPQDQNGFETFLVRIFETRKFKNTVGGLMKIARAKMFDKNEDDDLPF